MVNFRVEFFYYCQYYLTTVVLRDDLRKPYDLSSLKGMFIAGAPSTKDFKQKVVALARLSMVSAW